MNDRPYYSQYPGGASEHIDIHKDLDPITHLPTIDKLRINGIDEDHIFREIFKNIEGIDIKDPVFYSKKCYLWKGSVYSHPKSKFKTASFPLLSTSVYRHIYQTVFNIKLHKWDYLCHQCVQITGQHNQGLCVNPLHLALGCSKKNGRDRTFHSIIINLLEDTDIYCFVHSKFFFRTGTQRYFNLTKEERLIVEELISNNDFDISSLNDCKCNYLSEKSRKKIYDNIKVNLLDRSDIYCFKHNKFLSRTSTNRKFVMNDEERKNFQQIFLDNELKIDPLEKCRCQSKSKIRKIDNDDCDPRIYIEIKPREFIDFPNFLIHNEELYLKPVSESLNQNIVMSDKEVSKPIVDDKNILEIDFDKKMDDFIKSMPF